MTIIAKASDGGNNIQTLNFNGNSLTTINQGNQIWLNSADLAKALGYKNAKSITNLYNARSDEFTSGMTLVIESVTKGFGNGNSKKDVRIFSLRGCHMIGMFARTKVAKQFRQWVLDVLDNEVGAPAIQYEDLPSSVKDRNGLVKAARMAQSRLAIGYDEVFNLVHHRFNISRISELTVNQVGDATEYIQRLVLDQIAEPYAKSEHAQSTAPAIYGNAKPMIENTGKATKFVGTIDVDGRMSMRELQADEFVTTMEGIPEVLHMTYPPDPKKLAKIGMQVSKMLLNQTAYLEAPVEQIVGGGHEC